MPVCKKCNQDHFNFKPCPPRQDIKPQVEWKSDTDLAWGNRLTELKHLGGNSFVQRREYDR